MKKRLIIIATAALWVALIAITWSIGTGQAKKRTEAMLEYALSDIRVTIDGAINTMMEHLAVACMRRIGKADLYSREEVDQIAKIFDIDELNIADKRGKIISTNDPDCLNVDMTLKEETRPFTALTNGVTKVVAQPFRRHAYANSRRKYLGVPFPGGEGYIQIGLDESRMKSMIGSQFRFLFDSEMGDTVCYLCAEETSGKLVSAFLEDGEETTLEDIGFDFGNVPEGDGIFEETLLGRKAYCRSFSFAGHRIMVIEPEAEFYETRDRIVEVMTILLAFVLGAFALMLIRITGDSERIKIFYRKEEESRAKEMDIAKTIQSSALPAGIPDNHFTRVHASMTPARDVGGDFYDYFLLDSNHGAFLVADVSGKGITAALYMMTAKTIIKDTILSERDLSTAITKVNAELSRHNPANMFLTAWIGILDFETGIVEFVNAGHNPPIAVKKKSGEIKTGWIKEKSGPMLAFMEGVKYKSHILQLAPGEAIFLYTDGVTEAMDAKGELFGEERLLKTFSVLKSCEPKKICTLVQAATAAFTAGASAADDITVLAVEYISKPNRLVRSFQTTPQGLAAASAFLDECFAREGFSDLKDEKLLPSLHIILDEIASNIVKHSGANWFEVNIELLGHPNGVKLLFIDDGKAYDPLLHLDPDTTLGVEKRPIGGLGILMVKKMSDSLVYFRERNRNFLSVKKFVLDEAKK